jgi:hypothetical protein
MRRGKKIQKKNHNRRAPRFVERRDETRKAAWAEREWWRKISFFLCIRFLIWLWFDWRHARKVK